MRLCWIVVLLVSLSPAPAATFHLDVARGNDEHDGLTPKNAWRTFARATRQVGAGDCVVVHPGVYSETVQITRAGTVEHPVRFMADEAAKDRVIISGAVPELRLGLIPWNRENGPLECYSIPLSYRPARVLYDDVDLYPYGTLDQLKRTTQPSGAPGPSHGFAYDETEGRLYVRLHPGGAHGSSDPAGHVMKISPAGGSGGAMRHVNAPSHYNVGVLTNGPAYVILDGFTFETPGLAGVYLEAGHVTVRNCWFTGCRTAVSGQTEAVNDVRRSNDITIEQCDFSQAPSFDDAEEIVERAWAQTGTAPLQLARFYWWARKGGEQTYELGLAIKIGDRWKIRGNHIHDAVDGLSHWGVHTSQDLEISGNLFERLIDNAVETENHSANLFAHHNLIRDVFEPFSYQPQGGIPWPGPARFEHNFITSTPGAQRFWRRLDWTPGVVKIVITDENWKPAAMASVARNQVTVPGAGFSFSHNAVWWPQGDFFSFGGLLDRQASNFHFTDNILVTRSGWQEKYRDVNLAGMEFARNVVASCAKDEPGPGTLVAGRGGSVVVGAAAAGMEALAEGNLPATGSAAGAIAAGLPEHFGPIPRPAP